MVGSHSCMPKNQRLGVKYDGVIQTYDNGIKFWVMQQIAQL